MQKEHINEYHKAKSGLIFINHSRGEVHLIVENTDIKTTYVTIEYRQVADIWHSMHSNDGGMYTV